VFREVEGTSLNAGRSGIWDGNGGGGRVVVKRWKFGNIVGFFMVTLRCWFFGLFTTLSVRGKVFDMAAIVLAGTTPAV
jgi:hypothetical protein